MAYAIDLVGQNFGRLTVLKRAPLTTRSGNVQWICRCSCGTQVTVASGDLRSGGTKSCGCYRRDLSKATQAQKFTKHGYYNTSIYSCWRDMIQRCCSPSSNAYKYYGARGIRVCKRWLQFENFLTDMGLQPKGLTLERRNNDGNYSPSNCYWATKKEQVHNRRPQSEWFAPPGPRPRP